MPARTVTPDSLPDPLPALVLVVGDEDLLVERAISAVAAVARRAEPDLSETERAGGQIDGPELHEQLGPSLFGDARLMVIRSAQDVRTAALAVLSPYLSEPAPGTTVVLQHVGGAKGKAILELARKSKALEIGASKLTRPDDRADFVRDEVRRGGGRIGGDALSALMDAVGSDLRELAAVANQLVSDCGGEVTLDVVRAFHKGRAEVTGFAVSDLAVVGRSGPALEALRFALSVGVPYVVIADALADGVRSIAGSARRGVAASTTSPGCSACRRGRSSGRAARAAAGRRPACAKPWAWSRTSMPTSRARRSTRGSRSSRRSATSGRRARPAERRARPGRDEDRVT